MHYNFCRSHMTLTKANGGIHTTPRWPQDWPVMAGRWTRSSDFCRTSNALSPETAAARYQVRDYIRVGRLPTADGLMRRPDYPSMAQGIAVFRVKSHNR
jgi:hypothetical protein